MFITQEFKLMRRKIRNKKATARLQKARSFTHSDTRFSEEVQNLVQAHKIGGCRCA